jgi:hypothetical protein
MKKIAENTKYKLLKYEKVCGKKVKVAEIIKQICDFLLIATAESAENRRWRR